MISLLLVFPWIQLCIWGNLPHLRSPIQFLLGNVSVFLTKKKPWLVIVVHWSYAPPSTMDSNLRREWTKGATHSPWLIRGYKTSILMQRLWFWASAKLCFLKNNNLTVVISPTSAQLTLIPRLLAHMEKKRVGNSSAKVDRTVPQEQIVWYDRESKKNKTTYVLGHVGTSRLIGSGPIQPPVRPSKGRSDVTKTLSPDQWLLNH